MAKKKPEPTWKKIINHQLVSILFGFLLTGIVGIILTNHYNTKQKELEFELSNKQKDRERDKDNRQKEIDRERDQKEKDREAERVKNEKELEDLRNRNQREIEYQRTIHQKEIERERSFADEVNKIRVMKIGEVWEKIYELDRVFDSGSGQLRDDMSSFGFHHSMLQPKDGKPQIGPLASQSATKQLEQAALTMKEVKILLDRAADEASAIVKKNRFWVGEEFYSQIEKYIEINRTITTASTSQNFELLRKLFNDRDKANANIVQVRKSLLKE